MALTKSNIFSESYNIVKTFLEGISGLDPRNRMKPNWIHSSMPNVSARGFEGYPFIVISLDVNEENKSFDVDTSEKIFRVLIKVYSDEQTEVDTIADLVHNNFKDQTKMNEFQAREMSSSPFEWTMDQNGKKITFRTLGFIMRRRI